ncbi:ABC transporter substrate-binding protein [Desulfovibrio sp. JC010]|uniref:substrate-binding periplasmic protein n=1 Tax=Desulfovibrio sp. JC010 TaxID=2593641 RepID=UPI0013D6BCA9|nr:transporter substrate-binding domain-containing protein [Desulfovibrio sp. JC010]NDV28178.1 amino acid ABC transporter substrate-binding protein [Desulfovibrio sp. JC010]
MKKVLAACVAVMFLVVSPVCADETLSVLTEEWPPYNYTENGKLTGISTDLVRQTLSRAGYKFKINIKPWKRAYNEALKVRNTLLYTTSRTEAREKLFKWVGPLYPRRIVLFRLKKNNTVIINDFEELRKYKIGVLRGGSVEEYLMSRGFKLNDNLDQAADGKQNILKLFSNRIDLIPGSEMSMAHRLQQTPYEFSRLEVAYVLIDKGGYYIAINKDTPDEVVNKMQRAFDELIEEGVRKRIVDSYLGR